jgi:hypothetical protein
MQMNSHSRRSAIVRDSGHMVREGFIGDHVKLAVLVGPAAVSGVRWRRAS